MKHYDQRMKEKDFLSFLDLSRFWHQCQFVSDYLQTLRKQYADFPNLLYWFFFLSVYETTTTEAYD